MLSALFLSFGQDPRMALVLRTLTSNDEAAFLEGVKEWEGEDPNWYSFIWRPGMPFKEMLELAAKESSGTDLAPGRVPQWRIALTR